VIKISKIFGDFVPRDPAFARAFFGRSAILKIVEELALGTRLKWNGKFPEFPNYRKKGQPREVDQNFRNEFPEIFCSI